MEKNVLKGIFKVVVNKDMFVELFAKLLKKFLYRTIYVYANTFFQKVH